ncbi:MAG: hypothetical protein DLM59_01195 [Pseudonocardiales bacterium]|nr:MAG: hypothetical protein DLM59_01195 [Pseudonocardiales bacterium]
MRLAAVGKRYHRRGPMVLQDVELTVPRGTTVHAGGGNGSGKSSLLRVIAGVTAPSKGRVLGRPDDVGYVPERFPPAVRFSPRRYLWHLSRVRRIPPGRGLALLDRLGGADLVDIPMTELSKGSCQKVAVAQALMGDPALLVLDEAWTGLDATAQALLTAEVGERCDRGDTVVFTDHGRLAAALIPHISWVVAEGSVRLAPTVSARALVDVQLAGRPNRLDPASLAGVVHAETAVGGVRLTVEPEHCDALLVEVLLAGWSVRRVEPSP